jgi:diacylglycerol kinase family enzyme
MTVERAPALVALGPRLPILLNPEAGSKPAERTDEVREMLSLSGIQPVIELVEPELLAARVRELAQGGAPVVAVGGGDGTVSSAVNALIGTETVLVPLPLGTLNHFATRYGLATLEAAALALTTGSIITIAVGSANGHAFVNNASCGFYPHVVRHRERLSPLLSKWPAAVMASLLMLARRPLLELELELEGNRIERKTAALWIGLGRHSLRLPRPGDAENEGELLEIVLPKPHSRLQLFLLALRLWKRLRKAQKPIDKGLETLRTKGFQLRSRLPITVATDGEVHVLQSPVVFQFHPRGVRVLCMVVPDSE